MEIRLNIEHPNSENSAGLQVVDMFCYGIARKYEFGDSTSYELYKEKVMTSTIEFF